MKLDKEGKYMKGFLIGLTVFAGFVYGMLQINEYYDDRGACEWGLFSGGHYYHKERLDNVIKGLIKDIIKQDKNARKKLLTRQGKSEADINKTLKALEPKYNREREKIAKHCYLDFEKKPYFQKKSMEVKPSDYCEMGNRNNGNNSGGYMGYVSFNIKYSFDDESLKFFNLERLVGIEYDTGYFPCETKYQGLGETGNFVVR